MNVIGYVAVLAAVMLVAWGWAARSRGSRKNMADQAEALLMGKRKPAAISRMPDLPRGFGYKCQWFAIRTTEYLAVKQYMNLAEVQQANWQSGVDAAYKGYYFISPPVQGWTFVISSRMPDITETGQEGPLSIAADLSWKFGEAYYFGTHRVVEYHAWIKAVQGKIIRAYGYLGESGEVLVERGELTIEEMELEMVYQEHDPLQPSWPDEEDVMRIAARWTIDQQLMKGEMETGTGFVGTGAEA